MNVSSFDFYNLNKSLKKKKKKFSDRHYGPPILPHPKHFQISHFKYVEMKGKCQNIFFLIPIGNSKQPRTHPTPHVLTSNKYSHRKHNEQRDDTLYEALVFTALASRVRNYTNMSSRRGNL